MVLHVKEHTTMSIHHAYIHTKINTLTQFRPQLIRPPSIHPFLQMISGIDRDSTYLFV